MTALTYPDLHVDAIDISNDALAIAEINVARYDLGERVHLRCADGLTAFTDEAYDLVICNPPYVDAERMATLPPEFLAEPDLALAGGSDGMSFVRPFLALMRKHLNELGVVVLEIGHERAHFERAFPNLMPIWIPTSAGEDQVLLLTKEMLDDADVGGDSA
jgi:ribosomal protein L3 glutamine methyltransferase